MLAQSARDLERYDSRDSNSTAQSTTRRGNDQDRGQSSRESFSNLPGAAVRKTKSSKKSRIRGLVTGTQSKGSDTGSGKDRFARMEAERERLANGSSHAGADDIGSTHGSMKVERQTLKTLIL